MNSFTRIYYMLVAACIRFLKNRWGVVDPPITITQTAQNTLVLNTALEDFSVTVIEPPEFAGTYQVTLEDIVAGGEIVLVEPANGHNGLSLIAQ